MESTQATSRANATSARLLVFAKQGACSMSVLRGRKNTSAWSIRSTIIRRGFTSSTKEANKTSGLLPPAAHVSAVGVAEWSGWWILTRQRRPNSALTLQLLHTPRVEATSSWQICRQSAAGDYIALSCSSFGDLTRLQLEVLFCPFQTGVKSRRVSDRGSANHQCLGTCMHA